MGNLAKSLSGFLFTIITTGCAVIANSDIQYAKDLVREDKYQSAYDVLRTQIAFADEIGRLEAIKLIKSNDGLISEANSRFTIEHIKEIINAKGLLNGLEQIEFNLLVHKQYANSAQSRLASNNVSIAREQYIEMERVRKSKEKFLITSYLWGLIPIETQRNLLAEMPRLEVVETSEVGVITEVNSDNQSSASSKAATHLGAALAQSAYIDSYTPGNYSATSQVLMGVAGGLVGASVDRRAEKKYQHQYGILLSDGNVISKSVGSTINTTLPIGQCVIVENLERVDRVACISTVVDFVKYVKAKGLFSSSSSTGFPCDIEAIGLVYVKSDAACQEIK